MSIDYAYGWTPAREALMLKRKAKAEQVARDKAKRVIIARAKRRAAAEKAALQKVLAEAAKAYKLSLFTRRERVKAKRERERAVLRGE